MWICAYDPVVFISFSCWSSASAFRYVGQYLHDVLLDGIDVFLVENSLELWWYYWGIGIVDEKLREFLPNLFFFGNVRWSTEYFECLGKLVVFKVLHYLSNVLLVALILLFLFGL